MNRVPDSFFVQLSDADISRIQTIFQSLAQEAISAPGKKIVLVETKYSTYLRRAPGANKILKRLGPECFELLGHLVSVGAEALEVSRRADLTPSQKIGRTSLELFLSVTPLGLVSLGASVLWPEKTDRFKSAMFSDNIVTNFMSDLIVNVGGKRFQSWSAKPSWLDYV